MTDDEKSQRGDVLKLTYNELCNRADRQQKELQNQRETALRTLRATIILIGVIVTFSHHFQQTLASFASQPFTPTLSNVIGGLLIPLSGLFLVLSPIFAAWSLKDGHFSEALDPWDMQELTEEKLILETNGELAHPSENVGDWYQYMISEYAASISQNDDILDNVSFYLRLSHGVLALAPVIFGLGIWLSRVSF